MSPEVAEEKVAAEMAEEEMVAAEKVAEEAGDGDGDGDGEREKIFPPEQKPLSHREED